MYEDLFNILICFYSRKTYNQISFKSDSFELSYLQELLDRQERELEQVLSKDYHSMDMDLKQKRYKKTKGCNDDISCGAKKAGFNLPIRVNNYSVRAMEGLLEINFPW